MPKVLILGSQSESLLRFRGHLIRRLLDEGHQVVAAGPEPDRRVADTLAKWGAKFETVSLDRNGMNPARDLQTIWALHRLFSRENPEVFLGYTIKPVVYGLLAAWLADVPSRYALITGLGTAFTRRESTRQVILQTLASCLYGVTLRTSQRVIFQNRDDAFLFCARRLVGGPEEVAVVNGSGVDVEKYSPVDYPEGPTSFLLIGRLLKSKGIDEYVEAARRLKARHPEARFRLVGWPDDGPDAIDEGSLREWIRGDTIEYMGYLDDVRPAIADSSVYVLPSYREGTPRTVLEAMAMARPIVTTDVPGCRTTVEPGENGLLVPPRDVESLVLAMEQFIGDRPLIEALGKASRRLAVTKFDVEQVTDSLLAALELGDRRMPPPVPRDVAVGE